MNTYLLFKSLHLIAVISWMAGLLYLPRIFVYHSQNNDKPSFLEVLSLGIDTSVTTGTFDMTVVFDTSYKCFEYNL